MQVHVNFVNVKKSYVKHLSPCHTILASKLVSLKGTRGRTYLFTLYFKLYLKLYNLPPLISLTRRHEMFGSDTFSLGRTFFEERILPRSIRGAVITAPLWTRRWTLTLAFEIMVPRWFMIRVRSAARHMQWCMCGSTTKVSMIRPSISMVSGNFHLFQLVEGHVVHTIYWTGLCTENDVCSFEEPTWWVISIGR